MTPYLYSGSTITLYKSGVPKVISNDHPKFAEILDLLQTDGDPWPLVDQVNVMREQLATTRLKGITVDVDGVFYNGEAIHGHYVDRIRDFFRQGLNFEPLTKFLEKALQIESRQLRENLPLFVERVGLPIFPDGDIMAWKVVQANYHDWYTGKFDHSIGNTLEMPRSEVNDDRQQTCSTGFHVAAFDYLPNYHWGPNSRVLVMKIDPRDFVSIPYDYNNAKARVCKYTVVDEVPQDEVQNRFQGQAVSYDYGGYAYEEDDYDDYEDEEADYDHSADVEISDADDEDAEAVTLSDGRVVYVKVID